MLHFVLGRNGSGKTKYLHNVLADRLSDGKSQCVLLVPEQFSFESEREILKQVGPKRMLNAEILSFTRLAHRLDEYLGIARKPPVDDGVRCVLMSLALEGLAGELEYFSCYTARPVLLRRLLSFVAELKQSGVGPESLENAARELKSGTLKTKLRELRRISSLYNAMLSAQYSDDLDLLAETGALIAQSDFFEGKTVCVDAFAGFTGQERGVLEQIMRRAKDVYISLCTDRTRAAGDFSVFEHVTAELEKLRACARRQGVREAKPVLLPVQSGRKPDALNFLEENLFSSAGRTFDGGTESLFLCAAGNRSDECDYVASRIKRLMREKGLRCREIAVVERSPGTYDRDLAESFKKYGVPFFEDRRQPVADQPLAVLTDSLLKMLDRGISTEDLMRYLKTGLTGLGDGEVSELENYAVLWKIDGGRWALDFTANPDGLGTEFTGQNQKKLSELNGLREKAVVPILDLRESFREADGKEKARLLYDFLVSSGVRESLKNFADTLSRDGKNALASEQNTVWESLMSILDRLAFAVGDRLISAERFSQLFRILLANVDVGTIPQGLDEVMFGSAERMRIALCKAVFIVGANSGVFPLGLSAEGLLDDRERRLLKQYGVELADTAEYRASQERFLAYHALTSATQRLCISYALSDYKGHPLFPSELILQIQRLFPSVRTADTALLSGLEKIESAASAFEVLAQGYRRGGALTASLKEYFRGEPNYGPRLGALERLQSGAAVRFEDPKVSMKLFGKDMFVSASRCETFHRCPFWYFCKYGLNAKPRKTAEFDPVQSGTVIHFVLENILKKYSGDELIKLSRSELLAAVGAALSEYLEVSMGGTRDKTKRFLSLYDRLRETLTEVLEHIARELRVSDFKPSDFELKIDRDAEIPPYTVRLPNGGSLQIRGSVDRVDVMTKNGRSYLRVVDYKSGGKKFALSDIFAGLNMQMLIYLFAICAGGGKKYGDIVPSGVLYMPAKRGSEKLGRAASAKEIDNEKLRSARLTGLIANDAEIILGMDRTLSGLYVNVLPDRKGGCKGDLIEPEALDGLRGEVDSVLRRMALSLQSGAVPALPVNSANCGNSCDYCDYKAVCGFEDGDPVREIRSFGLKKAEEMLKRKEGQADGKEKLD